MGDHRLDLDRIIADLRTRRETLEKSIEETAAGAPERRQLIIATENLRDRLRGRTNPPDETKDQQTAPESDGVATEQRLVE